MDIEFGPAKDAINIRQHGVSLAFGEQVFTDPDRIIIPTIRAEDNEDRFKVIGMVGDRLWTAVYTMRGAAFRFVSVRKSNNGEKRIYDSP